MAKKKTAKHTPVLFPIEINVDTFGNFTYKANGADASSIRPHNGDKISWSARLGGIPIPFQVEFTGYSPFGFKTKAIRGLFGATDYHTVAMPNSYHGNLV